MDKSKGGLEEISQRTGLSRSTVSKALNNCGSVSSDTKQSVLEAARALDYVPIQKKRVQQHNSRWLVAAVMPETPSYFWGAALQGMKAAAERCPQLRLVTSLFSKLSEPDDALYCIDYARDIQPDLMIVTPPSDAAVCEKLREAAKEIPIVCFGETAAFDYLFYVGADFYSDGAALARAARENMKKDARLLKVTSIDLPMVHERDEGFRRTLQDIAPDVTWVGTSGAGAVSPTLLPAQLARDIHERFEDAFDAVYVSQGYMPQVLSALDKLKCPQDVAVYGYERVGRAIRGSRAATVLEQDPREQGVRCIEAVYHYLSEGSLPAGRRLYVTSHLHCGSVAEALGRTVTVTVDRPLGSRHPDHPEIVYSLNYGCVEGVPGGDGEAQDAYVLGVDQPVDSFCGEVIAVIHRLDDVEDKWVVAPPSEHFTKQEIAAQVDFVERYFQTEIITAQDENDKL